MKRIVIPVLNDQLSEHFTQCSHYEVFEIFKEHISKKVINSSDVPDNIINWLFALEASDIIAYNIDNKSINHLLDSKINLFVGIPINKTETIMENYLNGNLKSNTKVIHPKKESLTNKI